MGCLTVRPIATTVLMAFFVATTLFAAAQGQTPTTSGFRPAPSSGIAWSPSNSTSSTGTTASNTSSDSRNITTRSSLRSSSNSSTAPGPRDSATESESSSRSGSRIERGRSRVGSNTDTPETATKNDAASKAAADRGAGRDSASTSTTSGGAPQTIGGTGGEGGGTSFTRGEAGSVTTTNQGDYEPILEREPEYGEVPDEGEPLTMEPMNLNEFLSAISFSTGWNMVVSPLLQDIQLNIYLTETAPKDALEVLKFNKIYYEFDKEKKLLRVMTPEEYLEREYGKAKPHEFKVSHADISYVESLINTLLSSTGRAITDPRTNNIYVWDTEDNINEMVRLVGELDVPLEKEEFTIQYAELPDIEAVLASAMSPSGSILADVRTGQILVWDKPAVLEQMRDAVVRLDQPVESKTFYIEHVNAEDIIDSIEPMLTERGMMQVDPRFNTIIVTDLPTRIEKITSVIETLDQPLETRTWVIKYAYLDFIADQLEAYIPGEMGQIVLNEDVHQLTVTGLPSRLDEIDKLIKVWDIRRKQVLIEAHIVEVGTEIERAFNVNWSYFANVNGSPFAINNGSGSTGTAQPSGDGQTGSIGRLPYAVPRYGALELDGSGNITRPLLTDVNGQTIIDRYVGGDIALMLDYLDKQQKITILSSPRVTVQDSEEAVFENATRVPYVSGSSYYGGGGYGSYGSSSSYSDPYRYSSSAASRVEFLDVGTILSVLPWITEDENILLDISAEDSTYTDKNVVVDDLSRTVPEKTVRRADTQVRVNSGDTIVLGGLRRDRASHATTKTPLLGDLPLIGALFRNPSREASNNSLLIFITTTIVDESTKPESAMVARVDQEVADAQREGQKNLLERLRSRANKGLNEIAVSIGQGGHIFCKGENVNLDELRQIFFDAPQNMPVTVVFRKHPNAPLEIVNEATEAAMEAGLRIEFDSEIIPIVPSLVEP